MSRSRIIAGLLAAFLLLVLGAVAIVGLQYRAWMQRPVLDEGVRVQVVIPEGASWNQIVTSLEDAGLVTERRYFEFWAKGRDLDTAIRSGHFELEGPLELEDLESILRAGGRFDELEITLIEGQNIFQIADSLDAKRIVAREDFLRAARDREALDAREITGDSFEGYLFPDTYRVRKGSTAAELIERFHARFKVIYAEELARSQATASTLEERHGFDRHSFVTMASLVEKETAASVERPTIARVFYNRLSKPMKLQTDPTCVYSERTYKRRPRPSLCKDKLNRYSTYVIKGLPPGPIANPGRLSMRAAMAPDTSPAAAKYLFFVARRDGSGQHKFTETYAQHKRAVKKHLKKKRK